MNDKAGADRRAGHSTNPETMRKALHSMLHFAGLLLASIGLFVGCATMYSQHISFPKEYHPDEPGKIDQLQSDKRNFFHPQLMLESTLLLAQWEQTPIDSADALILTGRRTSGYFSAGAVVLLMLAGFFAAGWPGAILVALAAGLCPPLLAHSRYLKEEPALMFGIAFCVAAAAAMSRVRGVFPLLLMAVVLGIGCGLAASGKYVGLLMTVPAIAMTTATTWRRWWLAPIALLLMLGAGAQTWTTINHRAVADWETFRRGFDYERTHALEEHGSITMAKPNWFFIDMVWTDAMPHIKVLAVIAP
ncbi:MAG TPA: phospholipid carrier-dependent glycosyltransferase, partial [Tepidisphaeraceae bacterium]